MAYKAWGLSLAGEAVGQLAKADAGRGDLPFGPLVPDLAAAGEARADLHERRTDVAVHK